MTAKVRKTVSFMGRVLLFWGVLAATSMALAHPEHPVPRLNLPEKIVGRVGQPLEVYWRGVIEAIDPYAYGIRTHFENHRKGYNFPRYYGVVTTEAFAPKVLTIELLDNVGNVLTSGRTLIEVLPKPVDPEAKKYVLAIGDSLTAGGEWVTELNSLLALSNVEFVGNKGQAVKWVGYGGKSWEWFTAPTKPVVQVLSDKRHTWRTADLMSKWFDDNQRPYGLDAYYNKKLYFTPLGHYATLPERGTLRRGTAGITPALIHYHQVHQQPVNPFWDNELQRLSFKRFAQKHSIANVDLVYILLSWNNLYTGLKSAADHQEFVAHARTLIRQLHQDYPQAQVKLLGLQLPSLNGGLARINANHPKRSDQFGMVQSVFGLNLAYQSLCQEPEFIDYCQFVDVATQYDSENNMQKEVVPVNYRSRQGEYRGSDGVHPTPEGYLQIADIAYRHFGF